MILERKKNFLMQDYPINLNDLESQSIIFKVPKVQNDTLECTLEEMMVIKELLENPTITQKEMAVATGKSISTVKRIMGSLQKKGYIRRLHGKRYGKWEVLTRREQEIPDFYKWWDELRNTRR